MPDGRPTQGWGFTPVTRWWHYFRKGRSICVQREPEKWLNDPLRAEPGSGQRCPRCMTKLREEGS